jgi:choline dehydrogenase
MKATGMTYIRAQKAQIDAWEALGNPDWNWDALLPYYKKAEGFILPTSTQADDGASFDPMQHGDAGPVSVGFPLPLTNGNFFHAARDTWAALGQPHNIDPNDGDVHGFSVWPLTCVPERDLRADAAQGYYWPIADRPNLQLFRGTATRILWADVPGATASGVEYVTPNGKMEELVVAKEVILSAGTFRTPALLELSGVGNPRSVTALLYLYILSNLVHRILAKHGIMTKVDLPAVGENLQDQPGVVLGYRSNTDFVGLSPYAALPTMSELLGTDASARVRASLPGWASEIAAASDGAVPASAVQRQLELQHELIFDQDVPSGEILTGAFGTSLGSALWPLLPFSRGSVHIASADPLQYPAIDPRFLSVDFDGEVLLAVTRLARKFWATDPVAKFVKEATRPNAQMISEDASDMEWIAYLTRTCVLCSSVCPCHSDAFRSRAQQSPAWKCGDDGAGARRGCRP